MWRGPFKVVEQISPTGVIVDEELENRQVKRHLIHISRLKPVTERHPPSTLPEILLTYIEDSDESDSTVEVSSSVSPSLSSPLDEPSPISPQPEIFEGQLHYEVEDIVGHAPEDGNPRKTIFHVKFRGVPLSQEHWFDRAGLSKCKDVLRKYLQRFPSSSGMPKSFHV